MDKGRLEAFSDGVVAILITIMVLSLAAPHGADLAALTPLGQIFFSYVLSFVNLAIYWNNHHHLLQAASVVDGRVLWANMHLLFWLSIFPFATSWMGATGFAALPTALYGLVLLLAAIAYTILLRTLMAVKGQTPRIAVAVGDDRKGLLSLVAYLVATPLALVAPLLALALYVAVAVVWFVPDRRMERVLESAAHSGDARDKES